jgi:hypothetical protein
MLLANLPSLTPPGTGPAVDSSSILVAFRRLLADCRPWAFVAAILASSVTANGADWPQFRGPDGQGHSTEPGLPLTWSETENVAWRTPIDGLGWSSPVVRGR